MVLTMTPLHRRDNLLQSQQQEVSAMVQQLQALLPARLPAGHNPHITFMAHLREVRP